MPAAHPETGGGGGISATLSFPAIWSFSRPCPVRVSSSAFNVRLPGPFGPPKQPGNLVLPLRDSPPAAPAREGPHYSPDVINPGKCRKSGARKAPAACFPGNRRRKMRLGDWCDTYAHIREEPPFQQKKRHSKRPGTRASRPIYQSEVPVWKPARGRARPGPIT